MRRFLAAAVVCGLALGWAAPNAQAPAPTITNGALKAALDEWLAQTQYPGAALGIARGTGAAGFVSGVSRRAGATTCVGSNCQSITAVELGVNDLMLAGSTGKTFFAAVAVQMIEAGQLDLEAPISKYLGSRPWFSRLPNARDITVRHLMTHTSGLVRYEMNPKFTADLRAQPDKTWSPEEEIAYLLDATPPFAAGQGWDYSDTNYIVLGMILERITGTKLYDEVERRFLTPLSLTRIVPSTSRRIPGLIPGYAGPRDPLGLPDEVLVNGEFVINPQFEWAGGGFATSANDLARWGHALYTGAALTPKARALMIDAAVPAQLGPNTRYGLGVIIRDTAVGVVWGHSGFFPGYQTELIHVVGTGTTIALQVNSSAPRPPGTRSPLRFALDVAAFK